MRAKSVDSITTDLDDVYGTNLIVTYTIRMIHNNYNLTCVHGRLPKSSRISTCRKYRESTSV